MPIRKKKPRGRISYKQSHLLGILSEVSHMLAAFLPIRRKGKRPISQVQRGLLAVFAGVTPVLAIFCLFFAWYALPRYSNRWDMPGTSVLLSSPRYLAVNEEEELRIAVKNEKDNAIQVSYRLDGSKTVPLFVEQSGTNIFFTGTIRQAEQVERKVRMFVPYDFGGGQADKTLGRMIGLILVGTIEGQITQPVEITSLSTAPVPWPRTLFGAFFSVLTGVFVWFVKEYWIITKEALEKMK